MFTKSSKQAVESLRKCSQLMNPGVRGVSYRSKSITVGERDSSNDIITSDHVMKAYDRIKPYIPMSTLELSQGLSKKTNCQIFLKNEHMSVIGSYKQRGALNKLLSLSEKEKRAGVICSSAGNHAQAVSYNCTMLGIDSVMPETTPHIKVQRTADFGGRVVLHGNSFSDAYNFACELAAFESRTFVHAFDDPLICAGAGTVGIEMLKQNPFLDAIVVPLGGGGLLAGLSVAIKSINPRIRIYGVEAAAMPGMLRSVQEGKVVSVPKQNTMADGIAIENVGKVPFQLINKYVDDIVTVSEDELSSAVLQYLEVERTVVEPAGAASLSAIIEKKIPDLEGRQVGVVVTGSNIDTTLLGRILNKGLVKSGRLARISVTIRDVPGELAKICSICSDMRINIKEIRHERAFLMETVGVTQPIIDIEAKNFEHIEKLLQRLKEASFIDCRVITPYY